MGQEQAGAAAASWDSDTSIIDLTQETMPDSGVDFPWVYLVGCVANHPKSFDARLPGA